MTEGQNDRWQQFQSILECPNCRGSLSGVKDAYVCDRCRNRFVRYGGIPSLVPSNGSVALRYDIDWHPSTVPFERRPIRILKRIKRFIEENPVFQATAGFFLNSIFHNTVRAFLNRLVVSPETRVLDVGVRRGSFTALLRARVVGIDVDLPSLEYLAQRTNVVPIHATAEHLPFKDGAFDVVFCTEVLEHIENDAGVVREMARVTAKGGTLLATTPNGAVVPLTREIDHVHLRHYHAGQLRSLLSEHFQEVDVRTLFISKRLMEWEAGLYQRFTKRPSAVVYLLRAVLCGCQALMFHAVERFLPDRQRGYTLLATARRPKG